MGMLEEEYIKMYKQERCFCGRLCLDFRKVNCLLLGQDLD